MMNAIDFASSHLVISISASAAGLCLWVLIPKNVLDLCIQLIRSLIDEFEVASFNLSPRPFAQVLSEHGFDESRARLLRSRNAINPGEHFFRQCDRSLLFHTTIVPPEERGLKRPEQDRRLRTFFDGYPLEQW